MKHVLSFIFAFTFLGLGYSQQLVQVDGDFLTENNDKAYGSYESRYENGHVKAQYNFLDGKEHGPTKLFYADGNLKEEGNYNYGVKTGTWTSWNQEGKKIGIVSFDEKGNRDGIWEVWDDNGTKRAYMEYKKGKRAGTWKTWDENGKLSNEKKY